VRQWHCKGYGARTAYRLGAGLDVGLPDPCGVGWEAGVLWPCGVGSDVGLPWPCGVGWEAGVLWPCGVGVDVGLLWPCGVGWEMGVLWPCGWLDAAAPGCGTVAQYVPTLPAPPAAAARLRNATAFCVPVPCALACAQAVHRP